MERPIMKDPIFLAQKSAPATAEDLDVAQDLLDTLTAHKVRWQNEAMQVRLKTFTGWTAQIIQHEIDHCNGILI